MDNRPLAFIDIDGVLNRICSNSEAKQRELVRRHAYSAGLRWSLWLDPKDHGRLTRLAGSFELAWGTTWEHDAHSAVGEFLRVPEFSVVATSSSEERTKVPGVLRAAQGRPFVWFDDMVDPEDIDAPQPHRVFRVSPIEGLTDELVDLALQWAEDPA